MTEMAERRRGGWRSNGLRAALWLGLAGLLALPALAMRFTPEVDWTASDFVVMGALLGLVGLGVEAAVRLSGSIAYRLGALIAVLAAFLLVWVNLAVGFLGNEDNPANLLFLGVIGVALLGSIAAGFRAAGTARALFGAAGAQAMVGGVALAAGLGSPGLQGLYEVLMGTTLFGALWLFAAALFRKAASDETR